MWRYREAFPINDDAPIISFQEGFTPLIPFPQLTRFMTGDTKVYIKQDHLFQTGSYKDRGAAVMISKCAETGIKSVVEDSSGNAGCAVAAYSAAAGITSRIFLPSSTPEAKLAQIASYGARIVMIPGNRDNTSQAILEELEQPDPPYYAGHAYNPFFFHGTKSFAFEVCEQLEWDPPDAVFIPAGNGTLLIGAYLGFQELQEKGAIPTVPRLVAVQCQGYTPLREIVWPEATGPVRGGEAPPGEEEADAPPQEKNLHPLADGIAISNPVRLHEMRDAVLNTGGTVIIVTDEQIRAVLEQTGRLGFFIEPTAAVGLAGVLSYLGSAAPAGQERIVTVFTGHGLKNPVRK